MPIGKPLFYFRFEPVKQIRSPVRTMGERAVEIALELCEGKPVRQIHYVSTKIIACDSMRAIEE